MTKRGIIIGVAVLAACSDASTDDDVPDLRDAGSRDAGAIIDGPCESWRVVYDLTGSQFEIRGVIGGDRTNNTGPGTLTMRYGVDGNGERADDGPVTILDYTMAIAFNETGVETDILATAGPDACGLAMGTLDTSTITWSTNLSQHKTRGTVTCNGEEVVCAFAGLPPGEPQRRDNDYDLPLNTFALDGNGGFDAGFVEVPSDDDPGNSFVRLVGTETSSVCEPLPTGC